MRRHQESKRSVYLDRWGRWASTHYRATLLIASGLTVVFALGFFFLELNLTFYSILPTGSQKVRDLKVIEKEFPAATSIVIVLDASEEIAGSQGDSPELRVTAAIDAVSITI